MFNELFGNEMENGMENAMDAILSKIIEDMSCKVSFEVSKEGNEMQIQGTESAIIAALHTLTFAIGQEVGKTTIEMLEEMIQTEKEKLSDQEMDLAKMLTPKLMDKLKRDQEKEEI